MIQRKLDRTEIFASNDSCNEFKPTEGWSVVNFVNSNLVYEMSPSGHENKRRPTVGGFGGVVRPAPNRRLDGALTSVRIVVA